MCVHYGHGHGCYLSWEPLDYFGSLKLLFFYFLLCFCRNKLCLAYSLREGFSCACVSLYPE